MHIGISKIEVRNQSTFSLKQFLIYSRRRDFQCMVISDYQVKIKSVCSESFKTLKKYLMKCSSAQNEFAYSTIHRCKRKSE